MQSVLLSLWCCLFIFFWSVFFFSFMPQGVPLPHLCRLYLFLREMFHKSQILLHLLMLLVACAQTCNLGKGLINVRKNNHAINKCMVNHASLFTVLTAANAKADINRVNSLNGGEGWEECEWSNAYLQLSLSTRDEWPRKASSMCKKRITDCSAESPINSLHTSTHPLTILSSHVLPCFEAFSYPMEINK